MLPQKRGGGYVDVRHGDNGKTYRMHASYACKKSQTRSRRRCLAVYYDDCGRTFAYGILRFVGKHFDVNASHFDGAREEFI